LFEGSIGGAVWLLRVEGGGSQRHGAT
jgi:hypothetical protein